MTQFRKRKQRGMFGVTVTKRGVGGSVGKGPLRVSLGADGKVRRTIRGPKGSGVWDTKVVGDTNTSNKHRQSDDPPGVKIAAAIITAVLILAVVGGCIAVLT